MRSLMDLGFIDDIPDMSDLAFGPNASNCTKNESGGAVGGIEHMKNLHGAFIAIVRRLIIVLLGRLLFQLI